MEESTVMIAESTRAVLSIVSHGGTDLELLFERKGIDHVRTETVHEALQKTTGGGAIAVLATAYPEKQTVVTSAEFKRAEELGIRLFVEYPQSLPTQGKLQVRQAGRYERGVIISDLPDSGGLIKLPAGEIFSVPGCHLVEAQSEIPILAFGRVAGFDRIAFDLSGASISPLLFQLPSKEVLIATTPLSCFSRGRFAPVGTWKQVLSAVLQWLIDDVEFELDYLEPTVAPAYESGAAIEAGASSEALRRGISWFFQSGMLLSKEGEEEYLTQKSDIGPRSKSCPPGDGCYGLLEGLTSTIDHNGEQLVRWWRRADCVGEVAGAMALAGSVGGLAEWRSAAINLTDWLYYRSVLFHESDPEHPAYGLLGWHDRSAHGPYCNGWEVFYGDDNARAILGTLAASGALQTNQWDEVIIRSILGNFRTTGPLGFREDRINMPALLKNGWRHYFETEHTSYAPHFQAYLWSCYLWLYSHTGDEMLYSRTVNGIEAMMAAYPACWHWTNGIQQERARMLLPLSWLVRVRDTPKHRQWLDYMVEELLAYAHSSGAVYEQIGPGEGRYGPPQRHEDYGTSEAPLLQNNGDPVADLLYTINFAALGLHEAAAATGLPRYTEAAKALAEFLIRVQARSQSRVLDGAWFRAFDFERWEHWGSDADGDWGAWCVETGWTQGWICTVLAMRENSVSLWELGMRNDVASRYWEIKSGMIPDAVEVSVPIRR